MPDAFYVALLRPFAALVVLLVAFYVARWAVAFVPDGPLKRTLTKPRSNRCRWCERIDAFVFSYARSLWRKLRA